MLNYAFYEAFNPRDRRLPESPDYLRDLRDFFKSFPVYVFPTVLRGHMATESLNVLPRSRAIQELGSGSNVPQWNRWTGYKSFGAETTILSNIKLPKKFYIRLGKKKTPVRAEIREMAFKYLEGEYPVGLVSPILHKNLKYTTGTLVKMNPSPLYTGKVKGKIVSYQFERKPIFKPCQFKLFDF